MDNPTFLYDEVDTYPNCTVQVLRNSVTGETSVGWWINEEDDEEDSYEPDAEDLEMGFDPYMGCYTGDC